MNAAISTNHIENDDLLDAINAHNRSCESLDSARREFAKARAEFAEKALADETTFRDVRAKAELLRDQAYALLNRERQLWAENTPLLEKKRADLRGVLKQLEKESEDAVRAVTEKLGLAGISPHTMPAWGVNPDAAQHQFHVGHVMKSEQVLSATIFLEDVRQTEGRIPQELREAGEAIAELDRQRAGFIGELLRAIPIPA